MIYRMRQPLLSIRELTPDLLGDFLHYFDHDAFADNPAWASCYCYFYLHTHATQDWETRSAAENRQAICQRIVQHQMRGYLAYDDQRPVGWCHAAPRVLLPALQEDDALAAPDIEQIGAIVCFNVSSAYRHQGIARQLLAAACAGLQRQGMMIAEAYPRGATAHTAAANYHGPLAMYLSAGFSVYREFDDWLVVRRDLTCHGEMP